MRELVAKEGERVLKPAKQWLAEYENDHETNLDEDLVKAIQDDARAETESHPSHVDLWDAAILAAARAVTCGHGCVNCTCVEGQRKKVLELIGKGPRC